MVARLEHSPSITSSSTTTKNNNNKRQHSSGCVVLQFAHYTTTTTTCISMHNCQELYMITPTQRQSIWYVGGTNYRQGYNCFGYM